ncbi:hypothetical protein GCM10027579_07560 [Calidifontibacter terrae]
MVLRSRIEADVPVLHAELYEDVATRSRADLRPWRPLPVTVSPFAVDAGSDHASLFSVVERSSGDLAGEAVLWGIDRHNRSAHVGLALRPHFRGRRLGVDALNVLTGYGLHVLGMHRLQLETHSENAAMLAAATRLGYQREGRLRDAAWANGAFADQILMSILATDGRRETSTPASGSPSGA